MSLREMLTEARDFIDQRYVRTETVSDGGQAGKLTEAGELLQRIEAALGESPSGAVAGVGTKET